MDFIFNSIGYNDKKDLIGCVFRGEYSAVVVCYTTEGKLDSINLIIEQDSIDTILEDDDSYSILA